MKDLDKNLLDVELIKDLINSEEDKKSIGDILFPYLIQWKWFVISVVAALLLAFIYLRYAEKIYQVGSSVMLRDRSDKNMTPSGSSLAGMEMFGTVSNVDNEIEVMRSKSLIKTTVNNLKLHTLYNRKGRVKTIDLYKGSPILVTMAQEDLDKLKTPVQLIIEINNDKSVSVSQTNNGKQNPVKLNTLPALFKTSAGNVTISFKNIDSLLLIGTPIHVEINPISRVIGLYRSKLSIAPTSKTTSVLNLNLTTPEPEKGVDFLNTLVNVYNEDAIADKNKEALNTKDFIDERIALIDQELGDAERNVERYKKSQGLTDLQTDMQLSLQREGQYEQRLVDVSTQLNLVDYLDKYVNEFDNKNKLVPSNVGIEDPTLLATINEYNKQVLERERLLRTNSESNPVVQKLDGQIEALQAAVRASIGSVKQSLKISRNDAQRQVNRFRGQAGMAPTQERQFAEIAREQQIKSALFLKLLEKREENALALSASVNSAKILDEASINGKVAPKPTTILMAALLLGMLIPAMVIFLKDLLHYKIESRKDVERITKLPILGDIPRAEEDTVAVTENENKEADEAFRILRTNLLFTLDKDKKVIIVTSTEPKEGKTFVSINTAISLALLGKKVLLMGLDLRLPKLSEYIHLESDLGMSHYLAGYETDINRLIQPSKINDNLLVIPSGKVPPNPSELISKEYLDQAIESLKERFDYIVIDSAPVSLVTDTLIAARVADATMFVCRANYSHRTNLHFANELYNKKKLPNMSLVVNDVTNFQYGYGYGKKYGYGYGYGNTNKSKKKK